VIDALAVGPCHEEVFFYSAKRGRALGRFQLADDNTRLRNASGKLARWIEEELSAVLWDWEWHLDDVREPVLEELKRRGAGLVTELAGRGDRAELVDLLSDIKHLSTSCDMHIPWEFLYLGDPDSALRLDKFFGAKAVIGRSPSPSNSLIRYKPNKVVPQEGSPGSVPAGAACYGYAEDIRLASAKSGNEFAIFTSLGIQPNRLSPLSKSDPEAIEKLNEFLLLDAQHLAHFNSHAEPSDDRDTNIKGKLFVSNEYELDEEKIDAARLCAGVIVVLNCCFGHTMRHTDIDSTAERMLKSNVRAVVATTAGIQDGYATQWAQCFYKALFGGSTVPEAIIAARHQLLAGPNPDPSALLYAYLGEPSAALPPQLQRSM
jgi:hypothetical protein